MSTTVAQLHALLALRWAMVRSRRQRFGLLALALAVLAMVVLGVSGAQLVPQERTFNAALVTPTAFLVYIGLALLGPLAAGGGSELFPASEVVPHPIRPTTTFVASLVLAPLNIAWLGQSAALLALTSYVARDGGGVLAALALTGTFILATTVCGQAIAWWLSGARQTIWGRRAAWVMVAGALVVVAIALRVGLTDVVDRSPTRTVVIAMLQGAAGDYRLWGRTLAALVVITLAGLALGVRTTAYTLRRPPGLAARREARTVRRRTPGRTALRQLRTIDRAGIWRAPALRRGVLVIGVLPGAAAAAARVEWPALALTGGLVTAGAGLLFGVNVFCLDGPGALWLSSLPLQPGVHLRAKAVAIAEVCLACSAISVVAGATRARGDLSLVDVVAVAVNVIACTAVVVASCLRSSVVHPHRAEMRGPRDTPAPPGAMAAHSARLAVQTTLVGLLMTAVSLTREAAAPLLLGLAIVLLTGISVRRSLALYANPAIRANVATTVATG